MKRLFIFGIGYSGARIAARMRASGWQVEGTGRGGELDFANAAGVEAALHRASHVLSSAPPSTEGDPVLNRYSATLSGKWLGYLSSTGVYGDVGGAWVDESAPADRGRRPPRAEADSQWLARGAYVFRLPGIYGPGRSALERVSEGKARRTDTPGQVFSRIYVDDIASAIAAALARSNAPAGAYNIADNEPASPNAVIEEACRLLGKTPPPLQSLDAAGLSPAARAFYSENRRVANFKAKRLLGWRPRYGDFRAGLRALSATTMPPRPSNAPATA